jgi:hypothetical protein
MRDSPPNLASAAQVSRMSIRSETGGVASNFPQKTAPIDIRCRGVGFDVASRRERGTVDGGPRSCWPAQRAPLSQFAGPREMACRVNWPFAAVPARSLNARVR